MTQQLNLPLAACADDAPAFDAEAMLVFTREIAEIRKAEKDGN